MQQEFVWRKKSENSESLKGLTEEASGTVKGYFEKVDESSGKANWPVVRLTSLYWILGFLILIALSILMMNGRKS